MKYQICLNPSHIYNHENDLNIALIQNQCNTSITLDHHHFPIFYINTTKIDFN